MTNPHKDLLKNKSPEEMAEEEFRVLCDTQRMKRIPLFKMMQEVVDTKQMDGVELLWPAVLEAIALRMRLSTTLKVQLKRAIRARIRAERLTEEYDRDYAALGRENEELRIKLGDSSLKSE